MPVVAVVLLAAILHASWNAAAHGISGRRAGFVWMNVAVAAVALPQLLWVGTPERAAWPFLLGSVLVHLAYSLLLLRSYQLGDFGQTYPLARGTAPLVVALVGATVVGQGLRPRELAGVLVVCGGLLVLVVGRGALRTTRPAAVAAVLTGLSIATYTVLDGVGVRLAGDGGLDTLAYIAWLFALQGPLIAVVVAGRPSMLRPSRGVALPGLASGVVSLAAYGLVIWAQTQGRLATVAALRETSIVFGALIGAVWFRERLGPVRVAGSVVVLAGVLLLSAT